MSRLYYLAFGSNLHPLRLGERVPSARPLGRVELAGYRLAFHKRGGDGSGKGDLMPTGAGRDVAVGALYEIADAERANLDAAEGPGYRAETTEVTCCGRRYEAFVYVGKEAFIDPDLQPYRWYRDIVWHGARYHGAPSAYLDAIAAVPAIQDHDPERQARYDALLQRIQQVGRPLSPQRPVQNSLERVR